MTRITMMAFVVGLLVGGCVAHGWLWAALFVSCSEVVLMMCANHVDCRLRYYERKPF